MVAAKVATARRRGRGGLPARVARAVAELRVVAGALAVLVVLLAGASVPLYAVTHQNVLANGGENVALAVIFGSVGLVVARRQPRNPIGWLMLAGPALSLLSIDGTVYAELTYRPGYHLPFGVAGILLDASWFVGTGALALVVLLFPDGALPSPRWRRVLRSYLAVTACYTAITCINVISTPGMTPGSTPAGPSRLMQPGGSPPRPGCRARCSLPSGCRSRPRRC